MQTKLAQCITEAINKQRTIQGDKRMLRRKKEHEADMNQDKESSSVS